MKCSWHLRVNHDGMDPYVSYPPYFLSPSRCLYRSQPADTKKRLDGNLLDLLCLLKNGQKSESFAAHFGQHFNSTTSRTDLCKYTTFKVVNQLNPIGAMKKFTKQNCNLCMEEHLTTLKNIRDKRVTIMNNNSEIYGAFRHKTTFYQFFLSTDDPVFNG